MTVSSDAMLKTCENPYGDGNSSERICKVLEEVDLGTSSINR